MLVLILAGPRGFAAFPGGLKWVLVDGEVGGDKDGKDVKDLSEAEATMVAEAFDDRLRDLVLARADRRLVLEALELWDEVRES